MAFVSGSSSAATAAAVITPSNTVDLPRPARAIYVGTTGDIRILDLEGTDVTFPNVQGGVTFAQGALRVFATGTTATGLRAQF